MSFTSQVEVKIEAEMERIANQILGEVQDACPKQSGRTAKSFHIEKRGAHSYAIVSSKLTAYYSDQGNGSGRIYPRRAKMLKITNGINRTLGYARSVSTYEGRHYIAEVANRHR